MHVSLPGSKRDSNGARIRSSPPGERYEAVMVSTKVGAVLMYVRAP